MTTINLKDFYPWYTHDEYIEVSEEVAEELRTSRRREAAHAERVRYNKAFYSLDCDDGIEYTACLHEPTPQELLDRVELFVPALERPQLPAGDPGPPGRRPPDSRQEFPTDCPGGRCE